MVGLASILHGVEMNHPGFRYEYMVPDTGFRGIYSQSHTEIKVS